jgi:hypothetical protein
MSIRFKHTFPSLIQKTVKAYEHKKLHTKHFTFLTSSVPKTCYVSLHSQYSELCSTCAEKNVTSHFQYPLKSKLQPYICGQILVQLPKNKFHKTNQVFFFSIYLILPRHTMALGFTQPVCNINEYQESSWRVKPSFSIRLPTSPPSEPIVQKMWEF